MSAHSAIWQKTFFQTGNALRAMFRHSKLKQGFILFFMVLFEAFLLLLFRDGFRFLSSFGGAGVIITGRIFALFFLGLAWMLLLSSLVSSYATFFGSPEIPFLLVRPFSINQIVLYSFIKATILSSWAFFFIVLPFVGAYTWHQSLHPVFILWTVLFSIPFLFLCSSLGALFVLLTVRWLPKPGKIRISVVGLIVTIALFMITMRTESNGQTDMQFNLATMVPGMRLAVHPLSPGYWMSEGIMTLTRGHLQRGLLYLALLTSSAAVSAILVEQLGGKIFYTGWQRIRSAGPTRRKPIMFPNILNFRKIFPADISAMMAKDVRTFFRDPAQWTQALIFFGLLALYFSNLRVFNYDQLPDQWRSAMTFLNVFAVSAVLSSMGARFIYPQLSFEGHSFWMLGLAPTSIPRMLAAKFLLAFGTTSIVSISLIFMATRMLQLDPGIQQAALAVIAAVCLAVCGLSTGLGAVFINLDENNPAAIVSSFGGTLNIVLCLCFMLVAILPFGTIFHIQQISQSTDAPIMRFLPFAYLWLIFITFLATVPPIWLGYRSLLKRDF